MYWRRRFFLLVLPVVLFIALLWALFGGGGGKANLTTSTPNPSVTSPSPTQTSTSARPSASVAKSRAESATSSGRLSSSDTGAGTTCGRGELKIEAATSSSSFPQRSQPTFYLQVTNTSQRPCKHDLADEQVELTLRSGDARIWGSHDCQVQPGRDVVTLLPDTAVRRGIVWSGRTSAPNCNGTRLYAQAGTYELYASLSGQTSAAVTLKVTTSG